MEFLDSGAINTLFKHADDIRVIVNPVLMPVLRISGLTQATVPPFANWSFRALSQQGWPGGEMRIRVGHMIGAVTHHRLNHVTDVRTRGAHGEAIASTTMGGVGARLAAMLQRMISVVKPPVPVTAAVAITLHRATSLWRPGSAVRHGRTGGAGIMPREWTKKQERQYSHVKEGAEDRGASAGRAKEIAARTVNKNRAQSGQSRTASKSSVQDMSPQRRGGKRSGRSGPKGPTKEQLYNEAKQRNIKGRSSMSKQELAKALGK